MLGLFATYVPDESAGSPGKRSVEGIREPVRDVFDEATAERGCP